MAMTPGARRAKERIITKMSEQGYPTYAKMFSLFDLVVLPKNSNAIAFMEPGEGRISVHPDLDLDQICVIIRHEILHEFLTHEIRLLKKLAQEHKLDWDTISEMDLKDLKRELYGNSLFNIAADYEISNLGYTDEDKDVIRSIKKGVETLSGLVTEDDHPDWVNLSLEEMYDKLRKEKKELPQPPIGKPQQQKPEDGDQGQPPDQTIQDNSQPPDADGEGDSQGQGQIIHKGRFVNGTTFVDENGNPYNPNEMRES